MTPDKFEENFIIHDHEADCMRRFTPGAVLRRAQQVSTDHCDTLGLTAQVYEQTHTAFLLAKLSVQWHRQLHTGDEVHAVAHPSAPQRATYYRYYSEKKWGRAENYDLSVYSDSIGLEACTDLILSFVDMKLSHHD